MHADEMQQPALARGVPIAVGVVLLIAGALQFTAWKLGGDASASITSTRNLRTIFGFLGITNLTFVHVGHGDFEGDPFATSRDRVRATLVELAASTATATPVRGA